MNSANDRISTGNQGLDAVMRGGLPANRLYLLEGSPGFGKTTLALEFLLEGRSTLGTDPRSSNRRGAIYRAACRLDGLLDSKKK